MTQIGGHFGSVPLRWLSLGALNNGANAGLSCLNANNALSNANWNIVARQSGGLQN
jgi:hypothetical protein